MKILVVVHETSLSGANLGLLESLIVLKNLDIQLIFLLPTYGNFNKILHSHFPNARQLVFPFRWWMSIHKNWIKFYPLRILIRNFITIWDVMKILKVDKPDLIWSNTIAIDIGFFLSKFLKVKHIWYLHEFGTLDHGFKFNFGKFIGHLVLKKSGVVIANSEVVASHYGNLLGRAVPYLYYSMDLFVVNDVIQFTSKVSSFIIYGRISENKGHLIAVNAICNLIDDGFDVKLTIMGNSDDDVFLNILNETICDRRMQHRIKIIGYNSDPNSIVALHDVVLNCSLNEAFGRINVEARKLGKIIVAANTGSSKELIKHGFDGFIFTRGVVGLYECIVDICDYSSSDLLAVSRNGYNYVNKNFNSDSHLKKLISFLSNTNI